MKTIQITMDEGLLARLDADEETRSLGRSAVLRRAAAEYLSRRKRSDISTRYRQAYSDNSGIEQELENWADEGVWPNG